MRRLLDEIPSIPQIPLIAPMHLGITTRVMAKRLALQRESDSEDKPNDAERNRRRSSRFLSGASIPNSIIRSVLQEQDSVVKDPATRRKERDEFVAKLTKRLEPHKSMYRSIYDEDVDREALNKIKKELQSRSLLPLISRHGGERHSPSLLSTSTNRSPKADPWEELKEKRRITRRTSILAPLRGERRSTYESIKKAIQNSKVVQQLLNADNIEEQKVKQIQTGKSLLPTESEAVLVQDTNLKGTRRKERKSAKRKHSLKSEKSLNLPDKLISKKKAVSDIRKHLK